MLKVKIRNMPPLQDSTLARLRQVLDCGLSLSPDYCIENDLEVLSQQLEVTLSTSGTNTNSLD